MINCFWHELGIDCVIHGKWRNSYMLWFIEFLKRRGWEFRSSGGHGNNLYYQFVKEHQTLEVYPNEYLLWINNKLIEIVP